MLNLYEGEAVEYLKALNKTLSPLKSESSFGSEGLESSYLKFALKAQETLLERFQAEPGTPKALTHVAITATGFPEIPGLRSDVLRALDEFDDIKRKHAARIPLIEEARQNENPVELTRLLQETDRIFQADNVLSEVIVKAPVQSRYTFISNPDYFAFPFREYSNIPGAIFITHFLSRSIGEEYQFLPSTGFKYIAPQGNNRAILLELPMERPKEEAAYYYSNVLGVRVIEAPFIGETPKKLDSLPKSLLKHLLSGDYTLSGPSGFLSTLDRFYNFSTHLEKLNSLYTKASEGHPFAENKFAEGINQASEGIRQAILAREDPEIKELFEHQNANLLHYEEINKWVMSVFSKKGGLDGLIGGIFSRPPKALRAGS